MADPKTIADVLDKSIDKLSGGAAEVAKAVKQVAPHAWEVAVRQQVAEGWTTLIPNAVVVLVVLFAYALLLRTAKRWHARALAADVKRHGEFADASDFWFPFCLISALALILLGVACSCASRGLLHVANPEYYAAKAILEAVK